FDTGFGEAMNVARTIIEAQSSGLAGCHLEDQVNPKRCGHLDGKEVVELPEMLKKLRAAVNAKYDDNFLIIARTDSRTPHGLDEAIKRAKAFEGAGVDMIFPEALVDESEFEAMR